MDRIEAANKAYMDYVRSCDPRAGVDQREALRHAIKAADEAAAPPGDAVERVAALEAEVELWKTRCAAAVSLLPGDMQVGELREVTDALSAAGWQGWRTIGEQQPPGIPELEELHRIGQSQPASPRDEAVEALELVLPRGMGVDEQGEVCEVLDAETARRIVDRIAEHAVQLAVNRLYPLIERLQEHPPTQWEREIRAHVRSALRDPKVRAELFTDDQSPE